MKTKYILLLGWVVAFSSCSTAYRTGQTPDDVYYSPAPAQETYVTSNSQQDRDSYYYQNEDQEIRRGIQDSRYRGNSGISLDLGFGYSPYMNNLYGYNYSPYAYNPYAFNPYGGYKGIYDPYGYNPYGYSNFGSSYFGYGNYMSPYYGGYYSPVYVYPGIGNVTTTNTNNGPRRVNLGAYNNTNSNGRIVGRGNTRPNSGAAPVRAFSQTEARQTGVGNVIRRVFTPSNERNFTPSRSSNNRTYNNNRSDNNRTYNNDNNSRSNDNTTPARSFNNSPAPSTSSPSSGSSSGGSAPVRTFRR